MTAHDEVAQTLLSVLEPIGGELRLLGRIVGDEIIGNRSPKEVFFFVPDLHVISAARQASFGNYSFNHGPARLLVLLLQEMARLREDWEDDGTHKLVTVQIGDFFDMWREFGGSAQPERIGDDECGDLRDLFYRGVLRNRPCLKATMILGNHDTKRGFPLQEIPFQLKAFNRDAAGQPFLFVTHGDAFDVLEQALDDWLQEFVVHFLGTLTPVNKYPVAHWGRMAGQLNRTLGELADCIMKPCQEVVLANGAVAVRPGQPLPDRLVKEVADPEAEDQDAFARYWRASRDAARQFDSAKKLRVVVVGHSHCPAMLLHEPQDGGSPLLLMDVGAWIEKCDYPLEEGDHAIEANAQLGVIHGNDARLYQVRVP